MQLSEEHKAKMKAGRQRAAAERKAKGEKIKRPAPKQELPEFYGLTMKDCCIECIGGICCITKDRHCGHPAKGGIQVAHMVRQDVVDRYNRARKVLEHAKVDRRP